MKRFGLHIVIGFFVFMTNNTICRAAEDAAMVIDIQKGKAYYEAGEKKGAEVILMDFLTEGDRIKLTPHTTLVLHYFASGLREEITGPGGITIGASSSKNEGDMRVKADKVDYILPKSVLNKADLQQTGGVLLRRDRGLREINLLNLFDTTVLSIHPVFRWQPMKGVETYKLRVFDVQDNVCLEITTDNTYFTYTKSDLIRGKQYWWIVLALVKGKIVAKGGGQFSVLTEEGLEKVMKAERDIKEQYPQESTESLITLAMIYQDYELYDDAANIFRKLHQKYPQNKNFARRLKMLDPNFVMKQ